LCFDVGVYVNAGCSHNPVAVVFPNFECCAESSDSAPDLQSTAKSALQKNAIAAISFSNLPEHNSLI
jgi:hypothetical protein